MGKRITKTLPCELTEEEILETGHALAENVKDLNDLEEEKKEVVKKYQDRINTLDTQQRRLALAVQTGKEDREVECEWLWHTPTKGRKTLVRLDINETVRIDEMDSRDLQEAANERQSKIPFN